MSVQIPHTHDVPPFASQSSRGNGVTNSHLLVHEFDYLEAASIDDAITMLEHFEGRARLMAGGTDLLVMMKMERVAPAAIINIAKIPGLNEIKVHSKDGSLRIGPNVSIHDLHAHPLVRARYPNLAEACASFGSTQVAAMGTIGGNICNGSPAADTAPVLIALCAQLTLAGPHGKRYLPVEEFFLGPGKTALQPDEILVEITLPAPRPGSAGTFLKTSRVAADLAQASLAVQLIRWGDTITDVRLAMGSVAPKPIRLVHTEAMLIGQVYTPELVALAGQVAADEIAPMDDIRSTAWYRRQVTKVLLQDGLALSWQRAAESAPTNLPSLPPGQKLSYHPQPWSVLRGAQRKVEFTVNGEKTQVWVASNALLLNVLRDQLELTGTKYACGIGECSACTVQIDGMPMLSCLVLAVSVDGKAITTVEGLQDPTTGALDPLQEAFIDNTAFQCGYCTPGVLMTAHALLRENPHPSEEQVRQYLRGNMCRCTGYASIVRAVLGAAESQHGGDV